MEINKDDFADLVMSVDSVSMGSGGEHVIRVRDSYESRKIELEVIIPAVMRCGLREQGDDIVLDQEAVYYNGIQFVRVGPESDTLLALLAWAYGFPLPNARMKDSASFTCIVLAGDTQTLLNGPMKCKLFCDAKLLREDNDEDYCEFYLNIDLANRTLEIAEKDQDYRLNVIRALNVVDVNVG